MLDRRNTFLIKLILNKMSQKATSALHCCLEIILNSFKSEGWVSFELGMWKTLFVHVLGRQSSSMNDMENDRDRGLWWEWNLLPASLWAVVVSSGCSRVCLVKFTP